MEKLSWVLSIGNWKDTSIERTIFLLQLPSSRIMSVVDKYLVPQKRLPNIKLEDMVSLTAVYRELKPQSTLLASVHRLAILSFQSNEIEEYVWEGCVKLYSIVKELLRSSKRKEKLLKDVFLNAGDDFGNKDPIKMFMHQIAVILSLSRIETSSIATASKRMSGLAPDFLKLATVLPLGHLRMYLSPSAGLLPLIRLSIEYSDFYCSSLSERAEAAKVKSDLKINRREIVMLQNKVKELTALVEISAKPKSSEKIAESEALNVRVLRQQIKDLTDEKHDLLEDLTESKIQLNLLEQELLDMRSKELLLEVREESSEFDDLALDVVRSLAEILKGFRLILIGGLPRWRLSVQSLVERDSIVCKLVDLGGGVGFPKFQSNDLVIVNVKGMHHKEFYGVQNQLNSSNVVIVYTNLGGTTRLPSVIEAGLARHRNKLVIRGENYV